MACFFLFVTALLVVDLVSWFRTRALRRGTIPHVRGPPATASFSCSGATFLPALAGAAATAWGAMTFESSLAAALALTVSGTFIAVAGSVARVTALHAGRDALSVVLARRPLVQVQWSELRAMRPQATPVGGWGLVDARGRRSTLMPSDLFGHEEFLARIVAHARLRFDGRDWVSDRSSLDAPESDLPDVSLRER